MIAAPKFFGCAHEDLEPEMSRVPLGIPTWPGAVPGDLFMYLRPERTATEEPSLPAFL